MEKVSKIWGTFQFGLDLSVDEAQRVGRELTDYYDLLAEINFEKTKNLNKSNNQVEETSNSVIINKKPEANFSPKKLWTTKKKAVLSFPVSALKIRRKPDTR